MSTTKVFLVGGEVLEFEGSVDDVAKAIENAARSSAGTLAWLTESGTGERLGLNAAQVVTVRSGED